MNLQPTIEALNLTLSPLLKEDFEALYAVGSDPLVWEQHPNSNRYIQSEFEIYFNKAMEDGALKVIDKATSKIIGSSRYYNYDKAGKSVMIGYTFLSRAYWGGKTNTEMKHAMLDYALQHVDQVFFQIGETNFRSQKAIEKLGTALVKKFDLEGLPYRQYVIKKSDWKKITVEEEKIRQYVEQVRMGLLELHKILIDQARIDYEKQHGEVKNPSDWVRLLVSDAFFAWLHPLTVLITTIDELQEIELPMRELDAQAVRAEIENIIGDFASTPKDFRHRYLDIIQREPGVVIKLAQLKKILQNLPKYDVDKMSELLGVRQQWTAATKLKFFRPTTKQ